MTSGVAAAIGEQQVLQRRVGQHHAELGAARRDRRRDRGVRSARRDHDRPLAPGEQRLLGRPEVDERPRRRDVRGHQRERAVLAVLARAQRRDRGLVVGAAGEVEAADALDGEDPPGAQRERRRAHRVAAGATGRPSRSTRATAGPHSGHAFGWAWKRRSRGSSYSARQAAHIANAAIVVSGRSYGTPRTIVNRGPQFGAVDERVAVAAVGGVEELFEAGVAHRAVGRHERVRRPAAGALEDAEAGRAAARDALVRDRLDRRERRRLARQALEEALDRRRVALDLEHDAALVVADEAVEPERLGEAEDVRPEPDALDRAVDARADARGHRPVSCGRARISERTRP